MSVRMLLKVFLKEEAVLAALARCDWWLFGMDEFKMFTVKAYKLVFRIESCMTRPSALVSVVGTNI